MLYFIYATENLYNGLHGVYDYTACDCDSFREACDYGREMGYELINSYTLPEDEYYTRDDFLQEKGYEEWEDEYEDEYYEILNEVIDDYLSYEVYPFKEGVTLKDYNEWLQKNMPPSDFINNFCNPF